MQGVCTSKCHLGGHQNSAYHTTVLKPSPYLSLCTGRGSLPCPHSPGGPQSNPPLLAKQRSRSGGSLFRHLGRCWGVKEHGGSPSLGSRAGNGVSKADSWLRDNNPHLIQRPFRKPSLSFSSKAPLLFLPKQPLPVTKGKQTPLLDLTPLPWYGHLGEAVLK